MANSKSPTANSNDLPQALGTPVPDLDLARYNEKLRRNTTAAIRDWRDVRGERETGYVPPSVKRKNLVRCSGCGNKVVMPCLLCKCYGRGTK